ncbi:hypothetical protein [Spiroplasma endosymbiont of Asaphidion curtum]|uniref:hypothetical protein n=1 Tax=Spiroplasma endosymbiont of Asaphidion curtum TaxID=3066281 RepID=UPI00313B380A
MITNSDTTWFSWTSSPASTSASAPPLKDLVVGTWEPTTTRAINYLTENGNLNNFSNNQELNPSRILIFTPGLLATLNLNPCNNRNPRSLNSNLMCYKNSSMIDISSLEWEIDELDPYYEYHGPGDMNNDYFRVKGRWGHDLVEFKMSLKTAIAFKKFFYNNRLLALLIY